jgi:hypothetical protein
VRIDGSPRGRLYRAPDKPSIKVFTLVTDGDRSRHGPTREAPDSRVEEVYEIIAYSNNLVGAESDRQ